MIAFMARTWQPPLWRRIAALIAFTVFPDAALITGGISEGGPALPLCIVATVALTALGTRLWGLRIVLDADEVRVVNLFHTLPIPWSQVARFGYDDGLWIRRRDGAGEHRVSAFTEGRGVLPAVRRANYQVLHELETARKKRLG